MVVRLPEKMIRKCFGDNEKEWRKKKKVILRKRCQTRFLGIMGRKDGVCVGRCMCSRNDGGKKVICKK